MENASLHSRSPSHFLVSLAPLSLAWEAALGTQPSHINMRAGETLPLLPPPRRCSEQGLQQQQKRLATATAPPPVPPGLRCPCALAGSSGASGDLAGI